MRAQRAYSYELDLPLRKINQHRQLVNPELPEKLTPASYSEVVGYLSALVQVILPVQIPLQILGVGVHCSKLVHVDRFTV